VTGTVIGLLIGVDRHPATRGAWMVTVEAIAARLPALAAHVNGTVGRPTGAAGSALRRGDRARLDYERALVEALLALDGMAERAHRDDLVATLERSLGRPLGASRTDRVRSDLLNIVVACLDHQVRNALSDLVDAVRTLHGDTAAVSRLARLAARDPGRRLTPDEAEWLRALVNELPRDEVAEASRVAFGPLGPRIDLDAGNLAEIMDALSELMGTAGQSPPLLLFLRLLASRMHGPPAEALEQWVAYIADRWHVPLEELTPPVATAAPARSYVVVELREDVPNPDQYLLSIWLQHDADDENTVVDGRALLVMDEQPLTIEEIPGHVGEQLRRVTGQRVGPIGALTVEFVLPYRLLEHPVDQFRMVLDATSGRLGSAFPVVVRSLDRIRNQMIHHRWRARWSWFREHRHSPDPKAISWVRLEGSGRQAMEDALGRDPDGYSDEYPVCLVLSAPARGGRGARGGWAVPGAPKSGLDRAVRDGIEIGMPVMVWCRVPGLTDQFLVEMANQLNGRPLAELPAVVQRLRHEATLPGRTEDHLGRHVSLMWDDADRLPPSQALRAPT
jgi:hypothetical protein